MSTIELVKFIWNNWSDIQNQWTIVIENLLQFLGAVVTLASIITPLTTTPKDDALVDSLKAFMHRLAVTKPK